MALRLLALFGLESHLRGYALRTKCLVTTLRLCASVVIIPVLPK